MIGGAKLDVRRGPVMRLTWGRDKAKLKWWYKVATMPEHWYLRNRNGMSSHVEVDIGVRLSTIMGLDKAEWLEDIKEVVHLRASWV